MYLDIEPWVVVVIAVFWLMVAFSLGYIKGMDARQAPAMPRPSRRRKALPVPEPMPIEPSRRRSPTREELRRTLEPDWDSSLQWDGTPALTSGTTLTIPSRPPGDVGRLARTDPGVNPDGAGAE
jgi:hypothetical protein